MNENHLEQACLGWLESLEFTSLKGEVVSPGGTEGGREKYSEVVLQNRLRDAIERLNPGISSAEADAAVSRLALYSAQSMVDGNREVYSWLRDGVPVERIESDGTRTFPRVQVIDFAGPNDLLAVQQFTVHGQQVRRPDVVLFVNGLPTFIAALILSSSRSVTSTSWAQPMTDATWFVYMLECRSKRIYTGVTPRLDQRILAHQKGQGALFTKLDSPQGLIAAKPFPSQREARQVELQVKRLPAVYKRTLARLWSEQHPIDEIAQQLFPPQ